jgi:hypothetical protein
MSSADQADPLQIKELPIPSEQRVHVFVATPDERMESAWIKYGGASVFHHPQDCGHPQAFCGIALFRVDSSHRVPAEVWSALAPFFDRAGNEANVFEFCPVRGIFTRRRADWFDGRLV